MATIQKLTHLLEKAFIDYYKVGEIYTAHFIKEDDKYILTDIAISNYCYRPINGFYLRVRWQFYNLPTNKFEKDTVLFNKHSIATMSPETIGQLYYKNIKDQ